MRCLNAFLRTDDYAAQEKQHMKKHMLTIFIASLALLLLTACSHDGRAHVESDSDLIDADIKLEMDSVGVSFDTIVCKYVFNPLNSFRSPQIYTIYADNTVEVRREEKNNCDEEYVVQDVFVRRFRITNKERKAIENTIAQNKLWEFWDCPDYSVEDGFSEHIGLFKGNGGSFRSIGGYSPTEPRFREVADLIRSIIEDHSWPFSPF